MKMERSSTIRAAAVLVTACAFVTCLPVHGRGQDRHKIAYKGLGADSRYTQEHVIDVGDVPGHQVRIVELRRIFSADPPVYENVRGVEEWARGYSDYTDGNGHGWGYIVVVMENGDKIFGRYDGTAQAVAGADGSRKITFTGVTTLTGGTGRFRSIRGTQRVNVVFDPKSGYNESQVDGEYWVE
jgi:hypothetical protein